jgi:Sec-independent protein translocase protein TatA
MFDFSFSEFSLVMVLALLLLGPKELYRLYHSVRAKFQPIKQTLEAEIGAIRREIDEEGVVEIIIDDQGRPQKSYNLEKLRPHLKKKDEQ